MAVTHESGVLKYSKVPSRDTQHILINELGKVNYVNEEGGLDARQFPLTTLRYSFPLNAWAVIESSPDYCHWMYLLPPNQELLQLIKARRVPIETIRLQLALVGLDTHLGGV